MYLAADFSLCSNYRYQVWPHSNLQGNCTQREYNGISHYQNSTSSAQLAVSHASALHFYCLHRQAASSNEDLQSATLEARTRDAFLGQGTNYGFSITQKHPEGNGPMKWASQVAELSGDSSAYYCSRFVNRNQKYNSHPFFPLHHTLSPSSLSE